MRSGVVELAQGAAGQESSPLTIQAAPASGPPGVVPA